MKPIVGNAGGNIDSNNVCDNYMKVIFRNLYAVIRIKSDLNEIGERVETTLGVRLAVPLGALDLTRFDAPSKYHSVFTWT
jgi:hypothetical protein